MANTPAKLSLISQALETKIIEGISPEVEATETAEGVELTITTKSGKKTVTVKNGQDYELTAADKTAIAEEAFGEFEEEAEEQVLKAEGWAEGTQDGEPVEEDSPYYEHSAKYWAGEAEDSAEDAASAKTEAQTAAASASAAYGTSLLAANFSTESTYAVGDYVIYSGNLYRCTTAVTTAGQWNNSMWTQVAVGDEVGALKSAINVLEDSVPNKVNKPQTNPNGTNGQLLRTLGNGQTEWVTTGTPTDEQVGTAVGAWLDDHPEATTTVQDGSITMPKFADGVLSFVTPEMFGAVGDGVADDLNAMNQAFATGMPVMLLKKYGISNTLVLPDHVTIMSAPHAQIVALAVMDWMVTVMNISYLTIDTKIQELSLDGNSKAVGGIKLYKLTAPCYVTGLKVTNCTGQGIYLDQCQGFRLFTIKSQSNGTGIVFDRCNTTAVVGLNTNLNTGNGIEIISSGVYSGDIDMYGVTSEANGIHGILVDGVISAHLFGAWLEGNVADGIRLRNNAGFSCNGVRVTGTSDGNNRGVRCEDSGSSLYMNDYIVARGSGPEVYGDPVLSGTSVLSNRRHVTGYLIQHELPERTGSELAVDANCQGTDGWTGWWDIGYQNTEQLYDDKTYSIKLNGKSNVSTAYNTYNGGFDVGYYVLSVTLYTSGSNRLRFAVDRNGTKYCGPWFWEVNDETPAGWHTYEYIFEFDGSETQVGLEQYATSNPFWIANFNVKRYYPKRISNMQIGDTEYFMDALPTVSTLRKQ